MGLKVLFSVCELYVMRSMSGLLSYAAVGLAAFFVVATVLLTAPPAHAEGARQKHGRISCLPICRHSPATLAKAPRLKSDLAATLESVQYALSSVGDGGTYVWRRHGGAVSGVVQPTRSFRNAKGSLCRYLHLLVTRKGKTAKAEGIACRLADGRWNLEG